MNFVTEIKQKLILLNESTTVLIETFFNGFYFLHHHQPAIIC
jgi:hypothetical protein